MSHISLTSAILNGSLGSLNRSPSFSLLGLFLMWGCQPAGSEAEPVITTLTLPVYLRDFVGRLSPEEKARESNPQEPSWPGGEATIDFKAGQMFLSHDRDTNSFYMQAHEREAEEQRPEDEAESVSFWMTLTQATELAQESLRICAAGRPNCFLCGQPINPEGHVCPRANGHTVLEAG